jgi:hypothetical protein
LHLRLLLHLGQLLQQGVEPSSTQRPGDTLLLCLHVLLQHGSKPNTSHLLVVLRHLCQLLQQRLHTSSGSQLLLLLLLLLLHRHLLHECVQRVGGCRCLGANCRSRGLLLQHGSDH